MYPTHRVSTPTAMYRPSEYSTKPSGLQLIGLIQSRLADIVRRETKNERKSLSECELKSGAVCASNSGIKSKSADGAVMRLYSIGGYWLGFERSAYMLSKAYPEAESIVVNHPEYPFPVVGVSVSVETLRRYLALRDIRYPSIDKVEVPMEDVDEKEFMKWHKRMVKEFEV